MLNAEFSIYISEQLTKVGGAEGTITQIRSVGGGSINEAYSFLLGGIKYFLKINSADKFPGMFATEAKGLSLLNKESLVVPQPHIHGVHAQKQFLVLNYLERMTEDISFSISLGKGVAALHKRTDEKFGLDHANYIGSLAQDNTQHADWNEFFICRRMEPLLKQCVDGGEFPKTIRTNFDRFFKALPEIFPLEKPSLLHGDLWSGNKMNTPEGPAIFDPAAYYGHREMDIAMTKLFGGFDQEFYRAYHDVFPLEKGWERRIEYFNLYPLLVHTVLFGGSYAEDVLHVIRKF